MLTTHSSLSVRTSIMLRYIYKYIYTLVGNTDKSLDNIIIQTSVVSITIYRSSIFL